MRSFLCASLPRRIDLSLPQPIVGVLPAVDVDLKPASFAPIVVLEGAVSQKGLGTGGTIVERRVDSSMLPGRGERSVPRRGSGRPATTKRPSTKVLLCSHLGLRTYSQLLR